MPGHPLSYRGSRRSVVMAPYGMVATSQPLAAQAGIDILKAGGHAVDAAIATNAVLGVVEPMSCGIGGDLFAIVYDASTGQLHGLNASGRAPYAAAIEGFERRGLAAIPAHGPLPWSVPGCVDGWDCLRQRFGSMDYVQVLAPAIEYARQGFPVSDIIAHDWAAAEGLLRQWPDSAKTYLPGGRAPRPGEGFKNLDLAYVYTRITEGGRDIFYDGDIARRIAAFSKANDGLLTLEDLRDHVSTWDDPVSTTYRGYTVWELPPNGQGIAVLEMLNILEGYDLAALGHNSAETLHRQIEAKKLAYADRAMYYADPQFADVPVQALISKEYAERQRRRIDPNRAARDVPAGSPALDRGDTIYLTVVDRNRNAVSFIQSLYMGFGSGMVPSGLGFPLQNRGQLFALDRGHRNRLEPHKRPFHTIIPAMVTKDGRPWLSFGVMGGAMQPQGHMQVLCNLIDFGMDVQEAGDAPRFNHSGSAEPTGEGMEADGGRVALEPWIDEAVARALAEKGHRVVRAVSGFGGYQAIMIDPATGLLHGGSEPRKDGCAIGY
ncbi:MAG: gamma-glutamyltransferase [Candidatus Latescibacteria bacterium]|nr:gamma-glutamyltransferase [Candidatus Latescibacterota bacterium]